MKFHGDAVFPTNSKTSRSFIFLPFPFGCFPGTKTKQKKVIIFKTKQKKSNYFFRNCSGSFQAQKDLLCILGNFKFFWIELTSTLQVYSKQAHFDSLFWVPPHLMHRIGEEEKKKFSYPIVISTKGDEKIMCGKGGTSEILWLNSTKP